MKNSVLTLLAALCCSSSSLVVKKMTISVCCPSELLFQHNSMDLSTDMPWRTQAWGWSSRPELGRTMRPCIQPQNKLTAESLGTNLLCYVTHI